MDRAEKEKGTVTKEEVFMRQVSRCECGKPKSRYANDCRKCHREKMAASYAKGQAIVDSGKCPDCGSGLRHNNSMLGWWQCEQYGAEGFRARPNDPACSFQTFTN